MNGSQMRAFWMVLAFVAVGLVGFAIGKFFFGSASDPIREVAYWHAPMDPAEVYDEPGKSRMGMDLIPVYQDELGSKSEAPKGSSTGEREILYWQAPMNPSEIYDEPGKSSMGMDLVPVYKDQASSSSGFVSIDPAVVQNMGVRTGLAKREDMSRLIRTVGEVQYDEEKLYLVNTKVSGWIEKLYVNFVGEEVSEGEPLMEIYSPELVSTQEELLLARKNYNVLSKSASSDVIDDAERLLVAARERLRYWDIPEEEIDRLESTLEIKKTILIQAPASGVVVEQDAIEGAFISPGKELFRIADLSSVWVHASFYDTEVPWIEEGQDVTMELSYLPGKKYSGVVSYIYPFLRERARDVHVRLVFENTHDLDLKPGMYANIVLSGKTIENAITVPSEAIIRSGQRSLVFVARGEGRFEPREVQEGEIGGSSSNRTRILSGIQAGEEIVISAQFLIDSESRLQEAIQKMLSRSSSGPEDAQQSHLTDSDEFEPMADGSNESIMDHEIEGDMVLESDAQDPSHAGHDMPQDVTEHDQMMDMPMDSTRMHETMDMQADSIPADTSDFDNSHDHRGIDIPN